MLFGTHARLSDVDFGLTLKGRSGIKRVFEFKFSGVVKSCVIPSWQTTGNAGAQ